MTATFDNVAPVATPSAVSCQWRLDAGASPDIHQVLWWKNLTGQSGEASAGLGWIDVVHPEDRETVRLAWSRAVDGGEPYLSVFRVSAEGGGHHLLLAYGLPQYDGHDGQLAWLGQIIDITLFERSTTYAEIISELATALSGVIQIDEIPDLVRGIVQRALQADAVGVLLPGSAGSNLRVGASSGFTNNELSILVDLLQSTADGQALRSESRNSGVGFPGGDTGAAVCQIPLPTLGYQSVMTAPLQALETASGMLVVAFREHVHLSAVDCDFLEAVAHHAARALQITRALLAERKARAASDQAHRHLDLVANAARAAIAYLDHKLTVQFCNATFVDWFGIRERSPRGVALSDLLDADLLAQLAPGIERARSGELVSLNVTVSGPDQSPIRIDQTFEPNLAADGSFQGLAMLGFDVSDRERTIERSSALTRLSAALSQAASHDDIVKEIVQQAPGIVGASAVAVVMASAGQALVWSGPWEDETWKMAHAELPPAAPTRQVMERREPLIVHMPGPVSDQSPVVALMPGADQPGVRIFLPLTVGLRSTGVLVIGLPPGRDVTSAEIGYLQIAAGICAEAIDRARLHDSLQERESRFRHLADALPQIVWVSSGDGTRLEYLNRRWEEFTGVNAADISAGDISFLTHPDDRDKEKQRWQRSLRTGDVFDTEIRVRRSDGAYIWFLNRGVPIRGPGGEVETWFGTMTDIDAQRTTLTHQSVISALDAQIRLLSDPAQIMQTLATTVGRHLHVDRCFLTEVMDIDQGADSAVQRVEPTIAVRALWVAGEPVGVEAVRELAPKLSRQFASELRPGLVIALNDLEEDAPSEEARLIAAQLGTRAIIIVPYLRAGRWVAGITVHSLTPREWTAAELAIVESAIKRTWPLVERSRAVEALSESEIRLRHAAEAANFSSFDFDPRTGDGYWSADTLRVFRRQWASEPPGSIEELIAMVHPDDQERLRGVMTHSGEPESSNVVIGEFRHLTDDGEICWFLLRGSVQYSGDGPSRRADRIRGVLMDITVRKQEEEERLLALDAAAHDLKNPVATIRALAQVGMRLESKNDQPDDQMHELLKSIEGATSRLTAIIGDFLDTAHLRAGRELPLQRHMIELGVVLAERVDEWREAHPDRQFIHSSKGVAIRGCWDESRLRRVFDNLIGNAIKFSPEGGPVRVNLTREESGGVSHALVTIVDYGIGIAASDLARVQQTFERGSNVPESIPGTGMGLIAARLITNQHGGTLTLDSQESKGTTVVVRLPIEDCQ